LEIPLPIWDVADETSHTGNGIFQRFSNSVKRDRCMVKYKKKINQKILFCSVLGEQSTSEEDECSEFGKRKRGQFYSRNK